MPNPEDMLAGWTIEDHLAFDIGFDLPRGPVHGLRRALTDDERRGIAKAIVAHLQLSGWEFRPRRQANGRGGSQ
jgi:hypothetical protein